jgi:hypothetical protein
VVLQMSQKSEYVEDESVAQHAVRSFEQGIVSIAIR